MDQYLFTPFEIKFNADAPWEWMTANKSLPLYFSAGYLFLAGVGRFLMERREPKAWAVAGSPVRTLWNFFLASMSMLAFTRVFPRLIENIFGEDGSIVNSICQPGREGFASGASGLWILLFTLSKVR